MKLIRYVSINQPGDSENKYMYFCHHNQFCASILLEVHV